MNRPIPLCALGMLVAFFLPWLSFDVFSVSGFNIARVGMEFSGKGTATGIMWLWFVPGLALVAAGLGGKGALGRLSAIAAGVYPWAWLIYWYVDIGRNAGREAAQALHEGFFKFVGIGGYATLGCAAALIFLGIFGKSDASER